MITEDTLRESVLGKFQAAGWGRCLFEFRCGGRYRVDMLFTEERTVVEVKLPTGARGARRWLSEAYDQVDLYMSMLYDRGLGGLWWGAATNGSSWRLARYRDGQRVGNWAETDYTEMAVTPEPVENNWSAIGLMARHPNVRPDGSVRCKNCKEDKPQSDFYRERRKDRANRLVWEFVGKCKGCLINYHLARYHGRR